MQQAESQPYTLWQRCRYAVCTRLRLHQSLRLMTTLSLMQTTHGCGDLIFSSHTTFALVGVLTYTEYGAVLVTKVIARASHEQIACVPSQLCSV